MIGLYYTSTLAIIFGVAAGSALLGSLASVVFMDDGYEWSVAKMWAVWSLLAVGLGLGFVAVAMPVTSMTEARKTERGLGDGPRFETDWIDGRPVDGITEMADNYPNVATKCVWDGWRAFVTSNGDMLAVVIDESCTYERTGPSS